MHATEISPWTPLDLTSSQARAIDDYRNELSHRPPTLDLERVDRLADSLAVAMHGAIEQLMERDTIPTLCHIINGWGNGTYLGHKLTTYLAPFVHLDASGLPHIIQHDTEGEVHPWQSLAYAVMAGVPGDQLVDSSGLTLRQLALNCRNLNTDDGTQLGHLLFALATLDPDLNGRPFTMISGRYGVRELVELAVDAHYYGNFFVCRKFHLTEGLCAVSAKITGLEEFGTVSRALLNGQLDVLFPLGAILEDAWRRGVEGLPLGDDSLVSTLRDTLALGPMFENHCYYAGHLIELACFARLCGFEPTPEHDLAIIRILNHLNKMIPLTLPLTDFTQCFLHLGHYRRAATLYGQLHSLGAASRPLNEVDLAAYTVDFDGFTVQATPAAKDATLDGMLAQKIYEFAVPFDETSPRLAEVIAEYRRIAWPGFPARGGYKHFRRISPPHWPRTFHYELLEYPDAIGVEIHIENKAMQWIAEPLKPLVRPLQHLFPGRQVAWDPEWWGKLGRIAVLFPNSVPAAEVATGMQACIAETWLPLDALVRERIRKAGPIMAVAP